MIGTEDISILMSRLRTIQDDLVSLKIDPSESDEIMTQKLKTMRSKTTAIRLQRQQLLEKAIEMRC